MASALAQAALAPAHGDVPIGAVVVAPSGDVVAAGHNERELTGDPTAHAEVLAIRRAAEVLNARPGGDGWRLTDCTLVVTLEPCTMCAGAIVASRMGRLVFGAFDEKAGAVASLWDVVHDGRLNHHPEVLGGVRAAECSSLLVQFFGR